MDKFEKEYYSFEGFWLSESFKRANAKRIQQIYGLLPKDVNNILDIACGNGLFCNFVKQQNHDTRIIGLDRNESVLKYVQSEKLAADIKDLPFKNREFDLITALEVLEHLTIPNYERILEEICLVARKYIIVSVPNNQALEDDMTQCPRCKSIFNHDLHLRSFTRQDISTLFKDHGFRILKIEETGAMYKYFGYDVFSKIFSLKNKLAWRSPICVVCGFKGDFYINSDVSPACYSRNSAITTLKNSIKNFWPKITQYYWLVALYERK